MFLVMIQHQAYGSAAITVLGFVHCTNRYVQSCPRMACTSLIDHMNPLADVALEPHVEDINGWSMSTQLDQNQQRQLGEPGLPSERRLEGDSKVCTTSTRHYISSTAICE